MLFFLYIYIFKKCPTWTLDSGRLIFRATSSLIKISGYLKKNMQKPWIFCWLKTTLSFERGPQGRQAVVAWMLFSLSAAFSHPRAPHTASKLPSGRGLPSPKNPTRVHSCGRACCNYEGKQWIHVDLPTLPYCCPWGTCSSTCLPSPKAARRGWSRPSALPLERKTVQ